MAQSYLLSTVLMAVLVAVIVVAILRSKNWQDYSPGGEGGGPGQLVRDVAGSPRTWILGFLLLLAGFGGAAVVYVGGFSVPERVANAAGVALVVLTAGTLLGYVAYGFYVRARASGRPYSMAVGEAVSVLGLLFIAAVAAKLVLG